MAARDAERMGCNPHSRTRHIAVIDRVAQSDIRISASTDIAHGRKTGEQRAASIGGAKQRVSRHGGSKIFVALRVRIAGQVHVHVDETGQNRRVA